MPLKLFCAKVLGNFSRILLYSGRSISCADKTTAQSPPLRRVPGQIAPAQWPVGNVLFPTRLRCRLFAKFCFRSLKFALFRKAKSLGCFAGVCMQALRDESRPKLFFPSCRRRWGRQGRRPKGGPQAVALRTKADGFSGGAVRSTRLS
ncbi:hypothetical protein Dhaf_3003 [Desulfitobacterium hafniense DCB-2]|uniref:Uncharacterized protein n=1 Tax=Desulfitobacterium hafniense (strain DSM 10664 / DCB-2) TaxID=272564 RepID=B8FYV3_DESHD|nr:hypothetical protein Dhaf_3003 [Desulfitobacterium hafniense DCB-2]